MLKYPYDRPQENTTIVCGKTAEKERTMKVILEVGPRNEELIEKISEAKMNGEDIWDIFKPSSEMYDALYYACKCGDMMLEDQARYLQWLLVKEENEYYAERMLVDSGHDACMEALKSELDKEECGAWELWGIQSKSCIEHPITFAITRHEDGWEYYYMNSMTDGREDGVCDDPEATAYEAMCRLLKGFGFFITHVEKKLDYEAVVAEYESKIK